jgi:putative acetyltransferase
LGLILRAVRLDDAEALAELLDLPGYSLGSLSGPYQPPATVRSRLEQIRPGSRRLVAVVDGKLVGTASLERFEGRRSHAALVGIGVHDDWTGRGIGAALMGALVDLADNWIGLHRLEITTDTGNFAALALYKRFGFEIEGTHREYILRHGKLVDALCLARVRSR